jgi:pimeloyl-ACP methyl ester carboxylesterase
MSAALHRVDVDGAVLRWEERGAGERALVLVHGFTGSRDDFADVTDDLADLGRVLVVDQRGHGDASNPGRGYTLDRLAADLIALLDAAGVVRADLLGHSMGGMVALRVALAHPERVASLVLMDTAAGGVAELAPMFLAAAERVRRDGMEPLIEALCRGPLSAEDRVIVRREGEASHRARLERKLRALDPAAFVALGPLVAGHEPLGARLAEIACPTTVLVGEHDRPFRPHAEDLAASIAGARLVVVPGAGHSPQKSGREAWLDAVRSHVRVARRS